MGAKNTVIISKKLNNLMETNGLDSNEVALRAGVGSATVNRARRGLKVERSTANKIFGAFKRDAEYDFNKIEELLRAKGVDSISHFFQQMGLNKHYWANLKCGSNGIGDEVLFGLCAYLGVTPEELKISTCDEPEASEDELLLLLKENNAMLRKIIEEFDIR